MYEHSPGKACIFCPSQIQVLEDLDGTQMLSWYCSSNHGICTIQHWRCGCLHWWYWCFLQWLKSPGQFFIHHFASPAQKWLYHQPTQMWMGRQRDWLAWLLAYSSWLKALEKENQHHPSHGLSLQCHRTAHVHWLCKLLLWHVAESCTYPETFGRPIWFEKESSY